MKSKHDRTGVMRRQLFQVVVFDLRLTDGASASQALAVAAPAPQVSARDNWQDLLQQACADVKVSQRAAQACAVAGRLGVAVWDEVVEVADHIAQICGMKFLERRRFLGRVQ
jgi:hypothetical protein